jgi:hypothetical protein
MLSKLMFPSKKDAPSISLANRPNLEEGGLYTISNLNI